MSLILALSQANTYLRKHAHKDPYVYSKTLTQNTHTHTHSHSHTYTHYRLPEFDHHCGFRVLSALMNSTVLSLCDSAETGRPISDVSISGQFNNLYSMLNGVCLVMSNECRLPVFSFKCNFK